MLHGQAISNDSVGLDVFSPELREWSRGEVDSAEHRNEVIRAVNESLQRVRPPWQVVGNAYPSILSELRFVSIELDYILCDSLDGAERGIKVALRHLLKRSPFDGKTRGGFSYAYSSNWTRTSTSVADDTTEDQVITTSYVPVGNGYDGDIVEATYHPGSGFIINGGTMMTPWLAPDDRHWGVVS